MTNSPLLYILYFWPDTPISTTPCKSSSNSDVFMTSFVILDITHWEYFIILIKELTSGPIHIEHSVPTHSPKPKNPPRLTKFVLLPKTGGGGRAAAHACAEV